MLKDHVEYVQTYKFIGVQINISDTSDLRPKWHPLRFLRHQNSFLEDVQRELHVPILQFYVVGGILGNIKMIIKKNGGT